MVFQDWALFPHMTVERNVGYGIPRRDPERARRIDEALALVGLTGLGDRLPGTLSGGQQQRVALARALAPRPAVLLLDEPFSNLDTALRVQVRAEVHALLADLGVTSVFVTHDQDEAFVLGDHVAVMSGGRIVQAAPPAELYSRPVSPWVATFVGDANLIEGAATGDRADTPLGSVPLAEPAEGDVRVLVRPEMVHLAEGDGAVVEITEYYGHDSLYVVRTDTGTTLRVRTAASPTARRGDRVALRYAGPPTVAFPA
jgi:iron(III) transport system ATP-binding protein